MIFSASQIPFPLVPLGGGSSRARFARTDEEDDHERTVTSRFFWCERETKEHQTLWGEGGRRRLEAGIRRKLFEEQLIRRRTVSG